MFKRCGKAKVIPCSILRRIAVDPFDRGINIHISRTTNVLTSVYTARIKTGLNRLSNKHACDEAICVINIDLVPAGDPPYYSTP